MFYFDVDSTSKFDVGSTSNSIWGRLLTFDVESRVKLMKDPFDVESRVKSNLARSGRFLTWNPVSTIKDPFDVESHVKFI